ncbi:hypothetical protein ACHQM5_020111 [Ranunculus cassubicifolius]
MESNNRVYKVLYHKYDKRHNRVCWSLYKQCAKEWSFRVIEDYKPEKTWSLRSKKQGKYPPYEVYSLPMMCSS